MTNRPRNIANDILDAVETATSKWTRQKKSEERHPGNIRYRVSRMTREPRTTQKEAAWLVIEESYMRASANGTLPAKARQIYYQARPKVMALTDDKELAYGYFSQTLLPDYIEENGVDWDVVYDARGHFEEPHTNRSIGCGTIEVGNYLHAMKEPEIVPSEFSDTYIDVIGPDGGISAVLYCEKEGFNPLFKAVNLANRYDLMIVSNKGVSVTAARTLIDTICGNNDLPLFVLHDFDVAGFLISATLQRDTRRYQFSNSIEVIDLGLRLADIAGLEREPAAASRIGSGMLRAQLAENGATEAEIAILLNDRIELNAMTSDALVAMIERKLQAYGLKKVIPDDDLLAETYRAFHRGQQLRLQFEEVTGARFTFQTFDDDKERRKARAEANKLRKQQGQKQLNDPFAQIKHGTLARHWKELAKFNKAGAGIYVCVNETDGKGRKEDNIARIRAGYADLDGAPLDPVNAAKLLPHIINESSSGRFHACWLIADDMPLDEFEALQKGLIAHFNSDPAVHDLPRVLRIPGFVHCKEGTPFLSRILRINEIEPYKWKDLRETFPPPATEKPQHQERTQSTDQGDLSDRWRDLNGEAIRRYSDWVPDVLPAARKTNNGYRVSSANLGRDLEEDLSFHAEGIKDFGVHDMGDPRGGSRTPIDIVEQYLRKDFNEAVRWLAEKLSLDPQDYLPKPKPKPNGQGSGDAATDAEIARLAKLSTVQYERERVAAAEKLGMRSATLDKLVTNERAKQAYAKAAPEKAKQEQAAKSEAERLLTELNRDNCVVLDGARTRILRFEEIEHDAGGEHYVYRVPTFLRVEDFRNLYLNRRIVVEDRSRDVGIWWLHHAQRRQYPGIIFAPAGEHIINGKLNIWRGWGVTPRRGDWGLMREHIYEVCAARDDDVDLYAINWLAWAVQHPDEQPETALVFMGDRGTGRGTLGKVMCKLFGQHARHISSPVHMTGRFNAHMRQCSFLFADEAYAPGDKSAEGQLKRLITEPTLQIEPKGRDVMEEPNRLHVMFASNEDWVVPAGAFERRYVVQRVANTYRQDKTWFGPIYEQLRSGGYEAILFDLLERDLGDWHLRDIVRTAALAEQQEQSLSALDAWWLELLQTATLTGASEAASDRAVSNHYEEEVEIGTDGYGTKRTRWVRRDGLYDQARRISPKLKGESEAALGRYLNNQKCERKWVRGRRGWQFPPLTECRARWLERFPATKWLDPETKEWTCEDDD